MLKREVRRVARDEYKRGKQAGREEALHEIRKIAGLPAEPKTASPPEPRPQTPLGEKKTQQKRYGPKPGWRLKLPPAERLRLLNKTRADRYKLPPLDKLPPGK